MTLFGLGLVVGLSVTQAGLQAAAPAPVGIDTTPQSGVTIQIQKTLPTSWAHSPVRVTIENATGRDREWTFTFVALATDGTGSRRESRFAVSVPRASRTTRELVVPHGRDVLEQTTLSLRVSGFAIRNPGFEYALSVYGATQPALSFGISANVPLDQTTASLGTLIDPSLLPSDWRGLTGLRALVLTDDDWRGMEPSVRSAVLDWAARGGHFIEVSPDASTKRRAGLGSVARTPDWLSALRGIKNRPRGDYVGWASRAVPRLPTDFSWLTGFLIGYAMLIGPVNLFVLAPKGRRARLFWTMPVISVAASVFLALVILVKDGLGGDGQRVSLVYLMPETNREVVVQEQAARTGVLTGADFELAEPVTLFDVPTSHDRVTKRLTSAGAVYSGDWFRSRRVQAQRLEAVRPARARIEKRADGTFHVALEDTLEALYYRDAEGRLFKAPSSVAPGQNVTLGPVPEEAFEAWWRTVVSRSGPHVAHHVTNLYWERESFLAVAGSAQHGVIETLSGIHWDDDVVIYAGRLSQ